MTSEGGGRGDGGSLCSDRRRRACLFFGATFSATAAGVRARLERARERESEREIVQSLSQASTTTSPRVLSYL